MERRLPICLRAWPLLPEWINHTIKLVDPPSCCSPGALQEMEEDEAYYKSINLIDPLHSEGREILFTRCQMIHRFSGSCSCMEDVSMVHRLSGSCSCMDRSVSAGNFTAETYISMY